METLYLCARERARTQPPTSGGPQAALVLLLTPVRLTRPGLASDRHHERAIGRRALFLFADGGEGPAGGGDGLVEASELQVLIFPESHPHPNPNPNPNPNPSPNPNLRPSRYDDGTWQSVGTEQTLAGTWGMHASAATGDPRYPSPRDINGGSAVQPAGSSVWLKVRRVRCSET